MSCGDLKRSNTALEERSEHDKLKSYLNDLVHDNNVCQILAKREIGVRRIGRSNPYNLKNRRFIITGKNYFSKMWKITDMVHDLLRSKNFGKRPFTKEEITGQLHVIDKDERLDNLDIERINKCFLLIILDYGDNLSSVYGRNFGSNQYRNRVLEQVIQQDSLDHRFVGGIDGVTGLERVQRSELMDSENVNESVVPEIVTVFNSEAKKTVSVLHKNICYVSAKKVLHHDSWVKVCDY